MRPVFVSPDSHSDRTGTQAMTPPPIRPWPDCPVCRGDEQASACGGYDNWGHWNTFPDGIPCPTCLAHWRGVDEAVRDLKRLRQAFRYLADRRNWVVDDASGFSILKRASPQAGTKVGIVWVSAHVSPWSFADEVCPEPTTQKESR